MLKVRDRVRSVPKGGRGWVLLIVAVLLSGSPVGPREAHAARLNPKNQFTDGAEWRPGCSQAQLMDLNSGESINLSRLVGVHGLSLQVGDQLFDNFSFQFSDSDGKRGNDMKPSAISVAALAQDTGYGLSFTGPLSAIGKITGDVTIRYSVTVTDPNNLISAIHLSDNGSVCGKGCSSVVENVYTGKSCGDKLAQLEVLNPGKLDPVLQDLVVLIQPREKLYVRQDILLRGGGFGSANMAMITLLEDNFSQIPEPSTIALSVAGLATLLFVKRRQ